MLSLAAMVVKRVLLHLVCEDGPEKSEIPATYSSNVDITTGVHYLEYTGSRLVHYSPLCCSHDERSSSYRESRSRARERSRSRSRSRSHSCGDHQERERDSRGDHQERERDSRGDHQERERDSRGDHQERERDSRGDHQERERDSRRRRYSRSRSRERASRWERDEHYGRRVRNTFCSRLTDTCTCTCTCMCASHMV